MSKRDLAHRTIRLPPSLLILAPKSPRISQQAQRGLLTSPGPAKENLATVLLYPATDPEDDSVLSS